MSVKVLDSIKKQVEVLSPEEKSDLADFLLEQTNKTVSKTDSNGNAKPDKNVRRKRMTWLKENRQKYGGQYVVLDGNKLLGVAKTFLEGKKIATENDVPDAFVNYLSKPDEVGYIGGW